MSTANAAPAATVTSRTALWGRLALGTVASAVLFTVAWIVLSFISDGYTIDGDHISPYSNLTQPISGLGMGDTAPYMNTVFVLSGLLLGVGFLGFFRAIEGGRTIRRVLASIGLGLAPIGLALIGLFDLEASTLHFAGVTLAFQLPILTFVAVGLFMRDVSDRRLANLLLYVAAPITLILMAVFFSTFDQATTADGEGIAGLTQRLWLTWVLAWYAVLGWTAHRTTNR
ncbi:hypothetical protein [Nonomuraea sp. LPB2021202275-12-8]|uniref:hypothetical protein n=1 Tax=Nonomuraea sp. LPB2021202275-12-8 TaxID=3120159 RepID=UPI00300CE062